MTVAAATPDDVAVVAHAMRDSDAVEFMATTGARDRTELVAQLIARFGTRSDLIVAKHDGRPVAIGGLLEHRPHVLTLLLFATDAFPAIGPALVRFVAQRLFPPLREAGVHRIECFSREGYAEAHRFIEALGLRREGVLRAFGRGGEDFVVFAWVRRSLSAV